MASEVQTAASPAKSAESPSKTADGRLESIEQAVKDIHRQVDEMSEETITPAELTVVPGLTVSRPIPIVLEASAEDVVARWVEPHIWGFGGSEGEAIESLAEIIAEVWDDLHDDDMRLSGNARRMRAVMESYVAPDA